MSVREQAQGAGDPKEIALFDEESSGNVGLLSAEWGLTFGGILQNGGSNCGSSSHKAARHSPFGQSAAR
jgi:hypothetical protein